MSGIRPEMDDGISPSLETPKYRYVYLYVYVLCICMCIVKTMHAHYENCQVVQKTIQWKGKSAPFSPSLS